MNNNAPFLYLVRYGPFYAFFTKGTFLADTIACKKYLELSLSMRPTNHEFSSYSTLFEAMPSWFTWKQTVTDQGIPQQEYNSLESSKNRL